MAILLTVPVPLLAQSSESPASPEPTPIVTDRPSESAGPTVVPRRALQVEMGYKFSRVMTEDRRTDTHELPDLLLRFGVVRRLEARVTATGYGFKYQDPDGSREKQAGFNDVSVGVKWALTEEGARRPALSLLADVSLPVGDTDFTDDYVNPKFLLLFTNTLTERLSLTGNVGPKFITLQEAGDKRTVVELLYTAMLSGPVSERIGWFAELFGAFALNDARTSSHSTQAGLTFLAKRNLQLDVRAGVGAFGDAPDWLLGAGLAVRFPRETRKMSIRKHVGGVSVRN